MKISVIMTILVTLVVAQNMSGSNTTAKDTTPLFVLNNSPQEGYPILGSERLQALENSYEMVNGSLKTVLLIKTYNRTQMGNLNDFTLVLDGQWTHLTNSKLTLSCSLFHNKMTGMIALVKFDRQNRDFRLLAQLTLSDFTNRTGTASLAIAFEVGEYCQPILFRDMSSSFLLTPTANWTSLNMAPLPSPQNIKATSADLKFIAHSNKVFKFMTSTGIYMEIYSHSAFDSIKLASYMDRVIIGGTSITLVNGAVNPPISSVNYKMDIIQIKNGQTVVIDSSTENNVKMLGNTFSEFSSSPQLTKLGFYFQKIDGTKGMLLKHVDYNQNSIIDIQFNNRVHFMETINGINLKTEWLMNDNFVVMRNASKFNINQPCILAKEEAYQFLGSRIVFMKDRILSRNYPCGASMNNMTNGSMNGNMTNNSSMNNGSWNNMTMNGSMNGSMGNMSNGTNSSGPARLLFNNTNGTFNSTNMSMNGTWNNNTANNTWNNMTMNNTINDTMNNGSWSNMTNNGSMNNGSWSNMTNNGSMNNGSWSNMTNNGSMNNGSWSNMTNNGSMNNGSWSNMTNNGSMNNGSWSNMTNNGSMNNGSWSNMTNNGSMNNGSWSNMTNNGSMNNGSWSNMTNNGSMNNGSWSNMTNNGSMNNGSWSNMTNNGSMNNGSWSNMTNNGSMNNGSWSNMTNNGSMNNGSWSNMTNNGSMNNGSWSNMTNNGSMNNGSWSNITNNGSMNNGSWNNMTNNGSMNNGSWSNMTNNGSMNNGSWSNMTNNGSMNNGSWSNMTNNGSMNNGSWSNMTNNGSMNNGSWSNMTNNGSMNNGSWSNMTNNGSMNNGSWSNMTNNASMGNMTNNGSWGNNSMNNMTNGSWGNNTINIIPDHQLGYFIQQWMDNSLTDRLVWFGLYSQYDLYGNVTYSLETFDYGSLASINTVPPSPQASAFINFTQPSADSIYSAGAKFQWFYFKFTLPQTVIDIITLDYRAVDHIRRDNITLTGNYGMLLQRDSCFLVRNALSPFEVKLFTYDMMNETYIEDSFDANALVGSTVLTSVQVPSVWSLSSDCNRIRHGQHYFVRGNNGSWQMNNNSAIANISLVAYNSNLTIALGNDNMIYKYQAMTKGFVFLYDPNMTLPNGTDIHHWGNKVVLNGTSISAAWVYAYAIMSNGMLAESFRYQFFNYTAQPYVWISELLNRATIIGSAEVFSPLGATTVMKAETFFINYLTQTAYNSSFPVNNLDSNMQNYFMFGDNYFYWRQFDANNASIPLKEYVYYFDLDIIPVQISRKDIVGTENTDWKFAAIVLNGTKAYLFNQKTENHYDTFGALSFTNRIVNVTEITRDQAVFNDQFNDTFASEYVGGELMLCPPGCQDCQCASCLSGFVYDSNTQSCKPCAPGCKSCNVDDISICLTCIPGTFLNNSTNICDPCADSCFTCDMTADSCTKCQSGYYYNSTACDLCPANCDKCENATVCLKAQKGFTVTGTGTVRGCTYSCSECNPDNVTECTACANGLQLLNGVCTPCPSNCIKCNGNACGECIKGYRVNDNNVCVLKCQLPCIKCADNQPTVCLSCQKNSTLVSGQCILNLTCNTDSSCSYCGQGLGYFLMPVAGGTGDCEICPTINNCAQCNKDNTYACSVCMNGYYVESNGTCSPCNSNCSDCASSQVCSACKPGWTLLEDYSEGRCLSCKEPCATCEGSPNYCTSCIGSHTRKNWKCRNNTYVSFRFIIISHNPTEVLGAIDQIILGLLSWLGQADNDTSVVTLETITAGSTVVAGTAAPTGTSAASGTSSMSSGMTTSTTVPGTAFVITGATVSTVGDSTTTTEDSGSSNLGPIIGAVVGGIILIIIIIVIVILVKRNKNEQTAVNMNTTTENEIEMQQVNNNSFDKVQQSMVASDLIDNKIVVQDYSSHSAHFETFE